MPIYIYQNPITKEIKEVVQSVHDKHEYVDDKNIKWNRVFTAPQLNTEGTLDANCDARKFSDFTKNKKETIGDMWDRSAELSEKRKKIYGEDFVKKEYVKNWSKKRKNKKHPTIKDE